MRINADFSQRAIVTPKQYEWVRSPQSGIERVMLDRIGAEQARATSIVRYAPESYFPQHPHPGGEEILVLEGTFSEGDGDFPAGWYLRNPPGSSHQPFSAEGALIFVKLQQMQKGAQRSVRINTSDPAQWQAHENGQICPLWSDAHEQVCLLRMPPKQPLFEAPVNGAEMLVLAGSLVLDGQSYARGSWLRIPASEAFEAQADTQGVTIYLKIGHLPAKAGA